MVYLDRRHLIHNANDAIWSLSGFFVEMLFVITLCKLKNISKLHDVTNEINSLPLDGQFIILILRFRYMYL